MASTNARAFGGSAVFVDRSDFVIISNLLAAHSFGSAGAVGTFLSNDFLLSNATFLDITGDTEGAVSFSRGLRALLTGIRVDGAEVGWLVLGFILGGVVCFVRGRSFFYKIGSDGGGGGTIEC